VTARDYWLEGWRLLGVVPPADAMFAAVLARYAEPGRRYHTLQHIDECFERFSESRSLTARPGELILALWFHDAIYDPRASDNEAASAAFANQALQESGVESGSRHIVGELILATRHEAAPITEDMKLMVDIDLAILGAKAARFEEYEVQVRQEYSWVPHLLFRQRRAGILKAFLEREFIYSTALFRDRFEVQARWNLQRSLERLAERGHTGTH
jgi:predicted metal-dependent HD superfamily phosphohydrolase